MKKRRWRKEWKKEDKYGGVEEINKRGREDEEK